MQDDYYNAAQGQPQYPAEIVSLRRSEIPYLWRGNMSFMGDMLIDSTDVAKAGYRQGYYVESQDYFIVDDIIRIDCSDSAIANIGMFFDTDSNKEQEANFEALLKAIPEGCFRFEVWDRLPLQFDGAYTVDTRQMGNCSIVVYTSGKKPLYIPNSEKMAAQLRVYLEKQP